MGRKIFGFTLIELLIVVAVVGILAVMALFAAKLQIAKARDGRRKSDLAKIQKALEDYMNDNGCYPNPEEIIDEENKIICNKSFSPYLNQLPCDPINNIYYNYFYSYDSNQSCKSWYKIYAKLEYDKDPIIEKVGCKNGCGPSGNYNYWVSSPNMNQVAQIHPAEDWWPPISGATPPTSPAGPTPTFSVGGTPTPTPTLVATPTPTLPPGATPTPTPTFIPTPTLPLPNESFYGCKEGVCVKLPGPICVPNYIYKGFCEGEECCFYQCSNPQNECQSKWDIPDIPKALP